MVPQIWLQSELSAPWLRTRESTAYINGCLDVDEGEKRG